MTKVMWPEVIYINPRYTYLRFVCTYIGAYRWETTLSSYIFRKLHDLLSNIVALTRLQSFFYSGVIWLNLVADDLTLHDLGLEV